MTPTGFIAAFSVDLEGLLSSNKSYDTAKAFMTFTFLKVNEELLQ